jgi:hypothetical protein
LRARLFISSSVSHSTLSAASKGTAGAGVGSAIGCTISASDSAITVSAGGSSMAGMTAFDGLLNPASAAIIAGGAVLIGSDFSSSSDMCYSILPLCGAFKFVGGQDNSWCGQRQFAPLSQENQIRLSISSQKAHLFKILLLLSSFFSYI